jgi:hypothetical protein
VTQFAKSGKQHDLLPNPGMGSRKSGVRDVSNLMESETADGLHFGIVFLAEKWKRIL